ncbi:hypothetical protein SAMN05428959_106162 [Duganella sp. CF517]|uniref:hypothetical protein n=1 Tax=Duganella sp. CF517 TaxID=1881038 RepID=UPI0008CB3B53|nr:hypothetical protein [Duganella sp. CF517]SEO29867.1 hypothetical protein SAMN05428959_106162 [Duganella sp. CF517]
MERFLIVYRGAPGGTSEASEHNPGLWSDWFATLGAALIDRGSLAHDGVEVTSRLLGPKLSGSTLAGYSLLAAGDLNDAVRLAEACPIFGQQGWVEIARLTDAPA